MPHLRHADVLKKVRLQAHRSAWANPSIHAHDLLHGVIVLLERGPEAQQRPARVDGEQPRADGEPAGAAHEGAPLPVPVRGRRRPPARARAPAGPVAAGGGRGPAYLQDPHVEVQVGEGRDGPGRWRAELTVGMRVVHDEARPLPHAEPGDAPVPAAHDEAGAEDELEVLGGVEDAAVSQEPPRVGDAHAVSALRARPLPAARAAPRLHQVTAAGERAPVDLRQRGAAWAGGGGVPERAPRAPPERDRVWAAAGTDTQAERDRVADAEAHGFLAVQADLPPTLSPGLAALDEAARGLANGEAADFAHEPPVSDTLHHKTCLWQRTHAI
mmetsp:Transcript_51173/g.144146  ORF Transcript_51173/g.144146 Transcript_51173/m.144146 type:complete len:328 (+) Transcript_51173:95-1078(+)